jgi:hypothetical protein
MRRRLCRYPYCSPRQAIADRSAASDRRIAWQTLPPTSPSETEVIPAGHAASTADAESEKDQSATPTGLSALRLAALGVVFGDIGTSPF